MSPVRAVTYVSGLDPDCVAVDAVARELSPVPQIPC
jgi:hypothetical protein